METTRTKRRIITSYYDQLKARIHWRCFHGDIAGDSDTQQSLITCLDHLGQCDRDRIISIYVMSPEVSKASK